MSWKTYEDEHLMCNVDGHTLTAAAVISHDASLWFQSTKFPQFEPYEIQAIMKFFDEPANLVPTGLYLGGSKYMVIQEESGGAVIRGKKGAGGIAIKKTNQALVIGIYDEPLAPGKCNMIVETLGDYLIEHGL